MGVRRMRIMLFHRRGTGFGVWAARWHREPPIAHAELAIGPELQHAWVRYLIARTRSITTSVVHIKNPAATECIDLRGPSVDRVSCVPGVFSCAISDVRFATHT